MKEEIKKLALLLKQANETAQEFVDSEDGGTCNMDSVTINLKGKRKDYIEQLQSESGFRISKIESKYWKGAYFVSINLSGQGNRRTRMVQAATKFLKENNVDATTYYQMD